MKRECLVSPFEKHTGKRSFSFQYMKIGLQAKELIRFWRTAVRVLHELLSIAAVQPEANDDDHVNAPQ